MKKRQVTLWVSLLLVAMVVLAGCAPRAGAGMTADMSGDEMGLVVDLPAIVLDVASDGSVSIGNVPVAQMGAMVGQDLSALMIDPAWVDYLSGSGIQHMQVNNRPDGLLLLVNGEPIPSVAWDGESLSTTAQTLAALNVTVPMLEKLLPLAQNLGLGAIVRFPVAAGAALVPLYVEGDGSAAADSAMAQEEFLAAVGTAPTLHLPVQYAADGSWTVGDMTDLEWEQLTGAPWRSLRLNTAYIDALGSAGVKQMSFYTDPAGIHVSINGKDLPYLTWGNGELNHVLDLASQLSVVQDYWNQMVPGADMGEVMAYVESILPVIQVADTNVTVYFPDSSMASK